MRADSQAAETMLIWKAFRMDTKIESFFGTANYFLKILKADKFFPMQQLMRKKVKIFEWNKKIQVYFENARKD